MTSAPDEINELEANVLRQARAGLSPAGARRSALLAHVASGFAVSGVPEAAHPEAAHPEAAHPEAAHPEAAHPDVGSVPHAEHFPQAGDAGPAGQPVAQQTSQLGPAPSTGPSAAVAGSAVGRMFSLPTLVLGAVGAAALGFAGGYFAGQQPPGRATSLPNAHAPVTPMVAPLNAVQTGAADEVEAIFLDVDGTSDARGAVQGESAQGGFARPSRVTPNTEPEDSRPAEATFYQELSYVRRAQSALQKGDGALALALMTSLDELRTRGALLAERNVTKVLALCLLERGDEASAVAQRALQLHGAEVYRRRLEGSCASAVVKAEGAVSDAMPASEPGTASQLAPGSGERPVSPRGAGTRN